MTARTYDQFLKMSQLVSTVLNWHVASQGGRGKQKLCVECGQPYPCRTRLMLMGRESEAAGTEKLRLK